MEDSKVETESIAKRLESIRAQIHDAEIKSGRTPGSVRLCAVSKFHPVQAVVEAIEAGQVLFGENRVQEASSKFSELQTICSKPYQLHIIGTLQRNKIKRAVECASCIQSVDRIEVLEDIQKHAASLQKNIEIMFEMHTGEESKAGILCADELYAYAERCANGDFPNVTVTGLMTMAPLTQDTNAIKRSFETLRKLQETLNQKFPGLPVRELSMGMSADFITAIEQGSTLVRIGTAIFGERQYGAVQA